MDLARVAWRKSSFSSGSGNCVETADLPDGALIRDTQNRELGHLSFSGSEWAAFLEDVKSGAL